MRCSSGKLLVATVALITSAAAYPSGPGAPTATLDSGVIIGSSTALPSSTIPVSKFLGIPFAAPAQRFEPPVKPMSWTTPLNTTAYGPACIQQFNYPEEARNFSITFANTPPAVESEDCLYLNVYAPSAPSKVGRAVMFWIYGGGLEYGTASTRFYDGTSFAAKQDVIIVSINYRTNVFGFPMAPELPLSERNLGFLDQRLALDWVQRNIAAFGGDPGKVTIFGESAGAASVDELVTTMPINPPFRAAIMESGQTSFYVNLNNSNTQPWDALVQALNCSGTSALACVKAADALTIKSIEEHMQLAFRPVSDNITQLSYPEAARKAGDIAKVPVLVGTNSQEGRLFEIAEIGQNGTAVGNFLEELFPGQIALQSAIAAAYPFGTPGLETAYDVTSAIFTDLIFQCPCGILANDSMSAGIPTFRYYYNATFPNTQLFPGIGVYHSSEIPIVFGTYPAENATAQEAALSNYMQASWATFAKNPAGGPAWREVPSVAVLGTPSTFPIIQVPAGTLDRKCPLYAPVYAALGG